MRSVAGGAEASGDGTSVVIGTVDGDTLTGPEYSRRVSFNERLYLALEQLKPGFCIQAVFESDDAIGCTLGDGFEARLRAAITVAVEHNPGARLILDGRLGWTRWRDVGPPPPLRVVEAWPAGAPPPDAMERPLCPKRGPTCEVVLTEAPRRCLVFRSFHGVMDARGLLHFAEEVFRALRGGALLGTDSALNDTERVTSLVDPPRRAALREDCPPLATPPGGLDRTIHWQRRTLGRRVPHLVAKLSAAVGQELQDAGEALGRVMIPVDLRSYEPPVRSTANLSYPLFLDLVPGQTWRKLHMRILSGLVKKRALQLDPAESLARWLPLWILRFLYGRTLARHRRRQRFPFTSLVTHVSLDDAGVWADEGFHARRLFLLPPQSEFLPLCISAASVGPHTELVVSAPADLMGPVRLEELVDGLVATVKEEP